MQHAASSCLHELAVILPTNHYQILHTVMWYNLLDILEGWPFWLQDLSLVVFAILVGLIIIVAISRSVQLFIRKNTQFSVTGSLVKRLGGPLKVVLPLFIVDLFLPLMHFTGKVMGFVEKLV